MSADLVGRLRPNWPTSESEMQRLFDLSVQQQREIERLRLSVESSEVRRQQEERAAARAEAELERLRAERDTLRNYEAMVLECCGELETFAEYRAALQRLRADAARYLRLRALVFRNDDG